MNNFNTGDKVRRVSPICPATKRATGIQKDGIYTVGESYGGITLRESYQTTFTFTAANFELVEAMGDGDELPPAPESVSYLKDEGQRKLTASMYPQSVSIKIHLEYPGTVKCLGYSMEPDAALQLAHDLRRMAMEIKRKEKQNA